jgi:hypothetical protein
VGAEWLDFDDAADIDDGALLFRDRARLTGELAVTENGSDVSFSDIGVHR